MGMVSAESTLGFDISITPGAYQQRQDPVIRISKSSSRGWALMLRLLLLLVIQQVLPYSCYQATMKHCNDAEIKLLTNITLTNIKWTKVT